MIMGFILKKMVSKVLGSSFILTVLHATLFWTAFYKNGGFGNSAKGLAQKTVDFGRGIGSAFGGSESIWVSVQNILGWPCGALDISNHACFIGIMVVNSILWGIVLGLIVGIITGKLFSK